MGGCGEDSSFEKPVQEEKKALDFLGGEAL